MFSLGLLQDTVSTNKINLSWGELTSMYSDKELIIHPDHRSAFDWSNTKKNKVSGINLDKSTSTRIDFNKKP